MSYQSKHTGTTIDNAITDMQSLQSIILNTVYPVGSLYTSFNSTSPANIIGGTWEQIQNCFLMAAGSSYAIGTSGGSATHTHTSAAHTHTTAEHTLTVNEIPSHNHRGRMAYKQSGFGYTTGTWEIVASALTSPLLDSGNSPISDINPRAIAPTNNTGGGASHSHGDTGSTTPGATGASSSLPPYKTIYMWQRTA